MSVPPLGNFEGVQILVLNLGMFRKGVSTFLPGIGIIVGKPFRNDLGLLRHEYGHYLQRQKFGLYVYWRYIAVASLVSFLNSRKKGLPWFRHYDTWTEWSANRMSWEYLGRPEDWDHCIYPVQVYNTRVGCRFPEKLKDLYDRMISSYAPTKDDK